MSDLDNWYNFRILVYMTKEEDNKIMNWQDVLYESLDDKETPNWINEL